MYFIDNLCLLACCMNFHRKQIHAMQQHGGWKGSENTGFFRRGFYLERDMRYFGKHFFALSIFVFIIPKLLFFQG